MGIHASTAVAPGDTASRLFEQYGSQLYRFCMGRLRSREEAEDAVQSTFLRVYKALGKGAVPEYEAAWLYKIAHNVCLSRHEVVGRRSAFETPCDLDEIEYALAAPETRREELAGLSDALADMPVNLRQAILLREWQGLSYAEIADAMGTTVSAVETLIFRARKHLATALEPERRERTTGVGLLVALLGRFRDVLSVAGPAKVAVGAALLAAGAAGVGATVELQTGNAASGPKRATPTAPAGIAAVPVSIALSRAATVTLTPTSAAPAADATPSSVAPPATPAAVTPDAAPAATDAVGTLAAPAPNLPVPAAPLPGVTPPPLTPPGVEAPAATLPATPTEVLPSAPSVEAPTLPSATLPVTLPGH